MQILTIQKGFEAFEWKFEPFERVSKHSNANSNQCFTPSTQNVVQALKSCRPDKLISTSYGDSYVREFCHALLFTWIPIDYYHCMHQTCKCDFNCVSLGTYLGYIQLQTSTECESINLCASTGCVEPLPGHWVQCCTDGGYEQWWVEKNSLCWRQWRNTGMWTSAAWYLPSQTFTFSSLLSLCAVLVIYLFTVTLRAPHCPHTLLHLLVKKVIWAQQGLTALWWRFGLHLPRTPRLLHHLKLTFLSQAKSKGN